MILLRKHCCVRWQNIIIQSLFLSKHFPTEQTDQPQFKAIKAQSRKCQGFSRSPVNFRGHGFVVSNVMTYLLQLTIFARKEAQLFELRVLNTGE